MSLAETLKQAATDDWFDRIGNMEFIDDQKDPNDVDHKFFFALLTEKTRQQGMSGLTLMM